MDGLIHFASLNLVPDPLRGQDHCPNRYAQVRQNPPPCRYYFTEDNALLLRRCHPLRTLLAREQYPCPPRLFEPPLFRGTSFVIACLQD